MALTQMQIIQSLGEAMTWLEKELNWGVPATEMRHLTGRIGELYSALITNGQMATEVNQYGYDVVGADGERISVKTTAMQGTSGHINFNPNTLEQVDRVIILRINTDEMQIETLLNVVTSEAKALMNQPNKSSKASIALSKLIKSTPSQNRDLKVVNTAQHQGITIQELENGTIKTLKGQTPITPTITTLKEVANKLNISPINSNGNPHNTRQLGTLLIRALT